MNENDTQPVVNVPLLRKAVEWAEAEAAKGADREWYQGSWRIPADSRQTHGLSAAQHCGTAYCVAGYVGHVLLGADLNESSCDVNGQHVSDIAAEALGLPWTADNNDNSIEPGAHPLFDGDNTIEDVRRIAESLAGERL